MFLIINSLKEGDEMIYYTADQHFGHSNIIRLCNRPFNDITEMALHLKH
jgi:calcineurin-like phosphoesterase family protein